MNLHRFVGWRLEEAREALRCDEATRSVAVRLLETAAPPRKIDAEIDRFGGWRVLRAQMTEGEIELVVAREQIVD